LILSLLALGAGYVGFWAQFAPSDWYAQFPGFGLHWLPVLGPYNQHLSRDVGGLYLALLVLSAGALWRIGDPFLTRLTGAAWTAFNLPHLIFHLAHLDMYNTRDQILNVAALGGVLLAGAALLLAPYRSADR